jgi:putative heme-binding domain-containing protein
MRVRPTFLFALLCAGIAVKADEPDFAAGVRSTEPVSAEEQVKTFELPEGFKVSLFTAEPDIAKPMNMAFDSRGRLWVTSSLEYPFAAPGDRKAKDTLRVFEDTNQDGRADKVTTFADDLNIPIGVYPFNGGASALVWSIPNIWRMDDTDGDGVADKREVLLGPIGDVVDTHGMQNGFTRGFDGWIYVCHGFRNESVVRAKDGSEARLQSGNTYRFKLDGSHIEQYTWGQVNPFGMCLDPLGNHYTADCHSSPIYQLIRDGRYPSFGKPHDGLGFAPLLLQHSHGSTALCGVAYYTADSNWPEEFRDTLFVGNVMTSRVHRDQVVFNGSSPRGIEKDDFLKSRDPWFRPVDIQMGPDGALYVADFYNRIIGHYEVDLKHPGRDRYRGRVWRITYEGKDGPPPVAANLAEASMALLADKLADSNLATRLLAMSELTDRYGQRATTLLKQTVDGAINPNQKVAALWCLHRIVALDSDRLSKSIAKGTSREERVHALRIAGELEQPPPPVDHAAIEALSASDPFVVRQAAEALGHQPNPRNIPLLTAALDAAAEKDDHLRYVLHRSLRSQFTVPGAFAAYATTEAAKNTTSAALPLIAASIPTTDAANFLVEYLSEDGTISAADAIKYILHAARYVSPSHVEDLISKVRALHSDQSEEQARFYQAIDAGLTQRGHSDSNALRGWAKELSAKLLEADSKAPWKNVSFGKEGPPWILGPRRRHGTGTTVTVLSSLPAGGESFTGVIRSNAFTIPAKLGILLCGHDGYPEKLAQGLNYVRLCDAGIGGEIARVPAPRTDIILKRDLDLGAYAGKQGYLEVVDGDTGDAYAWLGFGGTEPPVVPLPAVDPRSENERLKQAVDLIAKWKFPETMPAIAAIAASSDHGLELRIASLKALTGQRAATIAKELLLKSLPPPLIAECIKAVAAHGPAQLSPEEKDVMAKTITKLPSRSQREAALVLAERRGEVLLEFAEAGSLAPRLLADGQIVAALGRSTPRDWESRVAALTKDVPSGLKRLQALAANRFKSFRQGGRAAASAQRGLALFKTQCAVCHQVAGQGNLIGPQLDGIGKRGAERVFEDILNPSQNVDQAFRLSYVTQNNGETTAGLFRREEGETLVFADIAGKEFTLSKTEVKNREDSALSLMPPIYGDALSLEQLHDLMIYLLAQ